MNWRSLIVIVVGSESGYYVAEILESKFTGQRHEIVGISPYNIREFALNCFTELLQGGRGDAGLNVIGRFGKRAVFVEARASQEQIDSCSRDHRVVQHQLDGDHQSMEQGVSTRHNTLKGFQRSLKQTNT
jgi:hypothetical protein